MKNISFVDFGLKWFIDIVGKIREWFTKEIVQALQNLTTDFFGTPLPKGSGIARIFQKPARTDKPWYEIYESVMAGDIMILALLILFICVQGRHFVRVFDVGNAYTERRTRRSAWTGAVLIVAWYWIAVFILYFVDAFTIALIPDMNRIGIALLELMPTAVSNPGITTIMAILGAIAMLALKAIYFTREVLLYVYLYTMPLGLAVAFGNVPILSSIARRFCRQFIPLAVLPLPATLLFRGYGLLFLGDAVVVPETSFLQYFVVISLPLLALYITWKTFRYASPLTAEVFRRGTGAAVAAGSIAGAGYIGGRRTALTTARFGPKAGAVQAAIERQSDEDAAANRTNQDNVANDNDGNGGGGGVPAYRRSENDPGYY
ncbi:MAG: hypothetical protein ABEI57_03715 [Halapricum sp.]